MHSVCIRYQIALVFAMLLLCHSVRRQWDNDSDDGDWKLHRGKLEEAPDTPGKTAVVYAWYENPAEVPNLLFFIKHAVSAEVSSLFDFIFVDTTPGGSKHIPVGQSNVRVIRRPNEGFDMKSWEVGLGTVNKADYDNFVFMNGCVRGPFLGQFPSAVSFVSPFVHLLRGNVHLAGMSLNCFGTGQNCGTLESLHLQSMFLVTDRTGVDVINSTLQKTQFLTKADSIVKGEFAISQNMLRAGYGLAAMQPYWRGNDFLNSAETLRRCQRYVQAINNSRSPGSLRLSTGHTRHNFEAWPGSDPYHSMCDVDPVSLSPRDIDPADVVMFKTNRGIAEDRLRELTGSLLDNPVAP